MTEAEGNQFTLEVAHSVLYLATTFQLLQLYTVLAEPLTIRMRLGQLFLDLAIVVYLTFLRIDEKNLARL